MLMPQRPNLSTAGGNTSSSSADFAFDLSEDVLASCTANQRVKKFYDKSVKMSSLELFLMNTGTVSSVQ